MSLRASVGSTEASGGRLARVGRIDRSNRASIDFGVVGLKQARINRLRYRRLGRHATGFRRRPPARLPRRGGHPGTGRLLPPPSFAM